LPRVNSGVAGLEFYTFEARGGLPKHGVERHAVDRPRAAELIVGSGLEIYTLYIVGSDLEFYK